jgi:two-component system, NarL family, nitrate/nitrite response regulator NarL
MREIAQHTAPRPVLRVMIFAADPVRRAGLMVIVSNAGHAISDDPDQADVVLADGVLPATDLPAVTLGGNVPTHAGLLPPDASPEQIDAAIRAVATGLVVRTVLASRPAFAAVAEQELNLLTPREVEVLGAISNGLSNKAIARQLGISQHTVKFHVEALLHKLGAGSRAEAVYKGLRQRLIQM